MSDTPWFAILTAASLALLGAYVMWAIEPVVHEPYRCADRGGIKQAIGDGSGSVESLVCNDGTIQSSTVRVHDVGWRGVGEHR
jgi:hypothetical protein